MKCPSCGRDNPDGSVFCTGCGTTLPRTPVRAASGANPQARTAGNRAQNSDERIRAQALAMLEAQRRQEAQNAEGAPGNGGLQRTGQPVQGGQTDGTPRYAQNLRAQQNGRAPRGYYPSSGQGTYPAYPAGGASQPAQRQTNAGQSTGYHAGQNAGQPVPLRPAQGSYGASQPAVSRTIQTGTGQMNAVRPAAQTGTGQMNTVRPAVQTGTGQMNAVRPASQTGTGQMKAVRPAAQMGTDQMNAVRRGTEPQSTGQPYVPAAVPVRTDPAVGYGGAAAYPFVQDWKVTRAGRSGLFLAAAICMTLGLAVRLFAPGLVQVLLGIMSGTGAAGRLLSMLGVADDVSSLMYALDLNSAVGSLAAVSGGVTILFKVLLNLGPALILTGVWIIYGTSRDGNRMPGGLTLIIVMKVLACIGGVLTWAILAVVLFAARASGLGEGELGKTLLIGALVSVGLMIWTIVYYIFIIKPMSVASGDRYAENGHRVSGFSVFLILATGILGVLISLFNWAGLLDAVATILFAAVLIKYKNS